MRGTKKYPAIQVGYKKCTSSVGFTSLGTGKLSYHLMPINFWLLGCAEFGSADQEPALELNHLIPTW